MSEFTLGVGISLNKRYITNTVPDATEISEMKYVAKGNDGCYIAEDNVGGVSRGYIHYIDADQNDVVELFYSYDGETTTVNIPSFFVDDGFGAVSEVDETAVLYQYLKRVGNEKVYVVSEDYSKEESMNKDQIMSEIENQVSGYGVPPGSVFFFDSEDPIPEGYEAATNPEESRLPCKLYANSISVSVASGVVTVSLASIGLSGANVLMAQAAPNYASALNAANCFCTCQVSGTNINIYIRDAINNTVPSNGTYSIALMVAYN